LLGLSYVLLQVAVIGELYSRLGESLSEWVALEAVAAVLGVVGSVWALRYYELDRRIARHFANENAAVYELVRHLRELVERRSGSSGE
jgi:hypothetical protein